MKVSVEDRQGLFKSLKVEVEDLEKTKVIVVLTTCPGCVLNLRDGVKKHKTGQEVMHLADYLAESLEEG